MKAIGKVALGMMLALGLMAPAGAQSRNKDKKAEAKPPKLSKGVATALSAVQEALKKNDTATALTQVRAAEAVPNGTAEDRFYIAQFKLQIAQTTQDEALLKEGIEGSLASDRLPPDQQAKYVRNLAGLAVRANDYVAATAQYERLAALTPNDPVVLSDLASIYIRTKQTPKALATIDKAIAVTEAAGQKPIEQLYANRTQLAYDNKMTAEVDTNALALVRAYPSQKNWNFALFSWRGSNKTDEQMDLDWFRLLRGSGAITSEGEYLDYAATAQQRGLPTEAKAVLDDGIAKGKVDAAKPNAKELRQLLTPAKIAADKASLPALEREARAAKTGRVARATADGYLSVGDFAKAADLYRLALSKGGEDANLVNLRTGYALAMTGDKAGADAAFAAVTGSARAGLARYYRVWAAQRA